MKRCVSTWDTVSDYANLNDFNENCNVYSATIREATNLNPFRTYVRPRPKLWFFCTRRFSWSLTLSIPIFLPPAYSPALIYFGRERGWWITCNYPAVLKEKIINRKSTTCAVCWLKSVLHEEKRREQENHNVGLRSCSRRFSLCSTDFSQQIAQVVLFLFTFFSFRTVG
jgi:hypothetical protein